MAGDANLANYHGTWLNSSISKKIIASFTGEQGIATYR